MKQRNYVNFRKNEKLNQKSLKLLGILCKYLFTLSQICNQLNELVDSKNYIPNIFK